AGDGLSDSGNNFLKVAIALESNLHALRNWREIATIARTVNGSLKTLTLNKPERSGIMVGHEVQGNVLALPLAQESEGLRRFLAHLLALYQVPPRQVLLFEEPEKGIYPGGFTALADEFRTCPDEGRGQV